MGKTLVYRFGILSLLKVRINGVASAPRLKLRMFIVLVYSAISCRFRKKESVDLERNSN